MYLQENTLFDLWPWSQYILNVAQYPTHHVIYPPVNLKLLHSMVLKGIYKKIRKLTFLLDVKVTRNVTQYILHHVTYVTANLKLLRRTVKEERNF